MGLAYVFEFMNDLPHELQSLSLALGAGFSSSRGFSEKVAEQKEKNSMF